MRRRFIVNNAAMSSKQKLIWRLPSSPQIKLIFATKKFNILENISFFFHSLVFIPYFFFHSFICLLINCDILVKRKYKRLLLIVIKKINIFTNKLLRGHSVKIILDELISSSRG